MKSLPIIDHAAAAAIKVAVEEWSRKVYHITFVQHPTNEHGTCRVIFEGNDVDGVDMNFQRKYTQAHIAIAKLCKQHQLDLQQVRVDIVDNGNPVGVYPVHVILDMAAVAIGFEW